MMVPTRQERKKNITTMRERQILDAARDVFSDKGFAAATTAEIAQKACVAEGTIYNYFHSKRELFIAVIKNLVITTPLVDLLERLPGADFPLIFQNILKNRLGLTKDDTMVRLASLMGEIQRDPALRALYAERFLQPFLTRMEGFYESAMSAGRFRRLEPAVAVRAVGGLIIGFLMLKMVEGEAGPLSRLPQEKVAAEITQFVLHGLLNDNGKA
jgi:AcrR family transcriptional regulator